ncbi:ATP-dependent protease [Sphingomonas sp. AP4-R1]|uniref:LON peptidase substrate-binding domain-containing protein n=1 Tax=Sphingomonas sp. AP4-R1 TaxID=2735134 RepID=UPI0014936B49|nr:LON peptidase substrate-binding domain-containing protein [Sphingomonas sp. AP4-R1]QJU58971.1 ATP-dependent protease [Sphingomonas sp. AP4-R1]
MTTRTGTRLSIFPLPGALLLPRAYLPLHIFEPRYRAMVSDALARDRRIAMIQPLPMQAPDLEAPALFDVGCVGRIAQVEAMEDGRFNLVLEGVTRFRTVREMDVTTPFRQIEAETFTGDFEDPDPLPSVVRADVEREARRFADAHGYEIEWDDVGRLDDEALVSGISQVAPFDIAAKQALLEAPTLADRADMLVDFLRFFGLDAGDEPTLQ